MKKIAKKIETEAFALLKKVEKEEKLRSNSDWYLLTGKVIRK